MASSLPPTSLVPHTLLIGPQPGRMMLGNPDMSLPVIGHMPFVQAREVPTAPEMPKTSFSRTLKELYAWQFTGNTGKRSQDWREQPSVFYMTQADSIDLH